MAKVAVHRLDTGDELLRMVRPFDWSHMSQCAHPACDRTCTSVYGWTDAQGRFIGWRAACSRKHALSIWMQELTSPASLEI